MNLLTDGIANGYVIKTDQATKHTIDNITKTYPVYRINIELLRFNNKNDRIATWLSQYKAENGENSLDGLGQEEYNKVIEKFISNSNPRAIHQTQGNIKAFGQRVPGVVLSDGLVIDGNRRLTCIRRIAAESHTTGWFEAVILEDTVARDPKRIKLLELSIQHGEEGKVDYDPVERLVGIYNDIIKDELLTPAEYARASGVKESEVKKLMDEAHYMEEFLEFANAKEQYHLARNLAVDGPLSEIPGIMRRIKSEGDKRYLRQCIYGNIIVRPEGDISRFVRQIKNIVGTDAARDFMADEEDAMEGLIDRMGAQPLTIEKVKELRSDTELTETFQRAMDRATRQVKVGKLVNAPVQKTEEAITSLKQITDDMLAMLNVTEQKRVVENARVLIASAQELITKLNNHA